MYRTVGVVRLGWGTLGQGVSNLCVGAGVRKPTTLRSRLHFYLASLDLARLVGMARWPGFLFT
jgi:hypothetical protein